MEFGLSLGNSAVSAFFFIDVDTSGTVFLQFKAGRAVTQAAGSSAPARPAVPSTTLARPAASSALHARSSVAAAAAASAVPLSETPISGCANVTADVVVHAGFNGTISGLSTKQFDVPVFRVSKNLFNVRHAIICLGLLYFFLVSSC